MSSIERTKRYQAALLIQQGACSSNDILLAMVAACEEICADPAYKGTQDLRDDPALCMMAQQLSHLLKPGELAVGDKVRFTALFLQSTAQHSGPAPLMRGVVTRLEDIAGTVYAYVDWGVGEPKRVHAGNVCRLDDRRSYAS
jgi:hypothetical protein